MNHGGDCRTAPDTPGLLNKYINFKKRIRGHLISQQSTTGEERLLYEKKTVSYD